MSRGAKVRRQLLAAVPIAPCRSPWKTPYPSQMVATNASVLHGLNHPCCAGVTVYECADHWHYGHHTKAASVACKAASRQLPPRHRPARTKPGGLRYETRSKTGGGNDGSRRRRKGKR